MQRKSVLVKIRVILIAILLGNLACQPKIISLSEVDKRSQIAAIYQKYARDFPQVTGISVTELQKLQQQQQNIVLVDVRSPEEIAVSMIPGAISQAEFEQNLAQYTQNQAVVVAYCTIGYRSGKYAEQLRKKGINILNLEGSLLAWSHIHGKLINATGSSNKIYVFGHKRQLIADSYQPVW